MHGKQNRRVDKCISLLMRFARDMMFERTIRMMKNKPTFRMEQIAQSHCRSIDIESSIIKKIDINTWLVHLKTPDKNPYTVSFNNLENCMGYLSCRIRVHQFICTCVDYKIKGNFCKHVHACIRVSDKNDTY